MKDTQTGSRDGRTMLFPSVADLLMGIIQGQVKFATINLLSVFEVCYFQETAYQTFLNTV